MTTIATSDPSLCEDPLDQLLSLEAKFIECFSQLQNKLLEKQDTILARIAILRNNYKRYQATYNPIAMHNETDLDNTDSAEDPSDEINDYKTPINQLTDNLKLQSVLLVNTLNQFSVETYTNNVLSAIDELNEQSFDLITVQGYIISKEPYFSAGSDGSGPGETNYPEGLDIISGDITITDTNTTVYSSVTSNNKKKVKNISISKYKPCNVCGEYVTSLITHMRTHTGEKPYSCVLCNRAFSQIGNLTSHMRTHTGEKPYSCASCNKAFARSCDLGKHKRLHTGEKPYVCEVCGIRFTYNESKKLHMRKRHV